MNERRCTGHDKLLEQAVTIVSSLAPEEQDEIAAMMLAMSAAEAPEPVDPAHLPAVLEGLAQAKRGQFATGEEVLAAALRRMKLAPWRSLFSDAMLTP